MLIWKINFHRHIWVIRYYFLFDFKNNPVITLKGQKILIIIAWFHLQIYSNTGIFLIVIHRFFIDLENSFSNSEDVGHKEIVELSKSFNPINGEVPYGMTNNNNANNNYSTNRDILQMSKEHDSEINLNLSQELKSLLLEDFNDTYNFEIIDYSVFSSTIRKKDDTPSCCIESSLETFGFTLENSDNDINENFNFESSTVYILFF